MCEHTNDQSSPEFAPPMVGLEGGCPVSECGSSLPLFQPLTRQRSAALPVLWASRPLSRERPTPARCGMAILAMP
jgi:hypothetical protein